MVDLGVSCINFGAPPDKTKPQPRFPGVSATAFTPSGALQVYTDILNKERETRINGQLLADKLPEAHDTLRATMKDRMMAASKNVGGLLPGHSSLHEFFGSLGYERQLISGHYAPRQPERKRRGPASSLEQVTPGLLRSSSSSVLRRSLPDLADRSGSAASALTPSVHSANPPAPSGACADPAPQAPGIREAREAALREILQLAQGGLSRKHQQPASATRLTSSQPWL
eukprot:TRINITY_DN62727_c0_g1_i1.p1 TRINITY_DN62727_c0_g1~~TRINITY_DN62727_c0_g1_i1.p1  ORF type:complete len:228 (-),score=35.49 TRINITY_DN62727_c0_g1_i1:9-692(-)